METAEPWTKHRAVRGQGSAWLRRPHAQAAAPVTSTLDSLPFACEGSQNIPYTTFHEDYCQLRAIEKQLTKEELCLPPSAWKQGINFASWRWNKFPFEDVLPSLGRGEQIISSFLTLLLFSHPVVSSSMWLYGLQHTRPPYPCHFQKFAQVHVHCIGDAIQPSHPLIPSPSVLKLSQPQGLFQWVSSSHQVTKILELQVQHQLFQCRFRIYFL